AEALGATDVDGATEVDGAADVDALGATDTDADGTTDGTGVTGTGVGDGLSTPPRPSRRPYSRIPTNVSAARITKAAEARSRTWTAISDGLGARWPVGGAPFRFPPATP